GRQPRIEDYLSSAEEPLRSPLWTELILAELACRRQQGEVPTLQEYLQRFPERQEHLQRIFTDGGTAERSAPTAEAWPELAIGGYELLGELARGGMGVVHKARQLALNRIVALKMIRAGQLASMLDVQRFRIEAEAAASLDHANIVPIYEVGTHQGQHYLAM